MVGIPQLERFSWGMESIKLVRVDSSLANLPDALNLCAMGRQYLLQWISRKFHRLFAFLKIELNHGESVDRSIALPRDEYGNVRVGHYSSLPRSP